MSNSFENKVLHGTFVIIIVGFVAKFASFICEAILAAFLGTTYQSDAYYMISSVQSVIYPMMSIGIWNVFMPLYKSHIAKNDKEIADTLTNRTLTFFTSISIGIVALLILFAPAVVSVVAPGFKGPTRELCIKLVRISAPMYIFIIASAVYASMLQCHNKFFGSQIREVASHIPTIIAALFFYQRFGIKAMAVALVAAGVLRLSIELPFVDWGYHYRPDFNFQSNEFVLMLKRLPSALVSAGVAQLNALIDKAMASTLPAGTISSLNYGHKLLNVFSGLLSSSVATALYPQMIELIALDKKNELGKLITKITNIFCVLMLPVTLACILFRAEIVSVVFQRGAFDVNSTSITANVFGFYSLSLFTGACSSVFSNVFYGHGDTRTPMLISLSGLLINVVLNLGLIHYLGVNGLALATSLSSILFFFVRLRIIGKYVELNKRGMVIIVLKVLIASGIACIIPRILFWIYPSNYYLVLVISVSVGIIVYFTLMRIFKVSELDDVISLVKKKVFRK